MKSLHIKGVPEDLYRELKGRAKANRRSLNSEVVFCLERVLKGRRRTAAELLAWADAVRESTRLPYLTDDALNAAKRDGRQ